MERKVIVIVGPTGSGKTALSLHLARLLKTEIISADSRQFYKYLDIGTAKPTENELRGINYHMIGFLMPEVDYNVSKFKKDSLKICNTLWNKGQLPIITGGSGLYIKSIIDGLSDTPDPDFKIRENLLVEKEKYGVEALHRKLKDIDPESAAAIHQNNWKRVIRAIEVYYKTGIKISDVNEKNVGDSNIKADQYGILWDRDTLYSRINERCDRMIEEGLVEEVRKLMNSGFSRNLNSLNTLGYKEIIAYLEGEINLVEAIELFKRNTRRYAKRQLTWFRKDSRITWQSINCSEDLIIFAEKIADQYKYIS